MSCGCIVVVTSFCILLVLCPSVSWYFLICVLAFPNLCTGISYFCVLAFPTFVYWHFLLCVLAFPTLYTGISYFVYFNLLLCVLAFLTSLPYLLMCRVIFLQSTKVYNSPDILCMRCLHAFVFTVYICL